MVPNSMRIGLGVVTLVINEARKKIFQSMRLFSTHVKYSPTCMVFMGNGDVSTCFLEQFNIWSMNGVVRLVCKLPWVIQL